MAVGLGSNLGDRRRILAAAIAGLAAFGEVVAVSPLYETAPLGGPDQGPYLNAVAVLDTPLEPRRLLEGMLALEGRMGRERRERWGPRTLDLDLLVYGDRVVEEPGLTVPHPRLAGRRFVLAPLADVWPGLRLPDGRAVADLLQAVAGQEATRIGGDRWWDPSDPLALLEAPPPEVSPEEAAVFAAACFGVRGEARVLEGERDRNFGIDGPDGRFVLKVANPASDPGVLDLQQAALEHLAGADPALGAPRAVRARDGGRIGWAEHDGVRRGVLLQTFLDGDRLPDGRSTARSRTALGALLARLDLALAGLEHPAVERADPWDLTRLEALRPHTGHLPDGRRAVVEEEIDRFTAITLPALAGSRRRVIHADGNPANLVTAPGDPDAVTGIVDFGDVMAAPLPAEVAIAAAYQCLGQPATDVVIGGLVAAYGRLLPLLPEEAAVVPGLVAARLAQSLIMSAWRASLHPDNAPYLLIHAGPVWEALLRVRALPPGWIPEVR